jgi:hypothetical protein
MERFETTGRWWLPGRDSDQVAGTLRFEPDDQPTLQIVGTFREGHLFSAASEEIPIILGAADGKAITLYQCHESQIRTVGFEEPMSTYRARFAFIGTHVESTEAALFDAVAVGYSNLDHWARRSGMSFSLPKDGSVRLEIQYSPLDPLEITLGDGSKVSVLSEFSTAGDWISSVSLHHRTLLGVKPPIAQSIDDYLNGICWYLQTLVTLGVGKPQAITCLKARHASEQGTHATSTEGERFETEVLFAQYQRKDGPAPHVLEMLFSLGDLGDALESTVSRWVSRGEELRPIYSLYFGTLFNPSMYVEQRFLSMVQAVESYHRRVYGGRYLDDVLFKRVYDALIAAIPPTNNEAFKSALKGRLKYHNELALRKRLQDLLEKHGELAAPVLPGSTAFVSEVVDTRNYLTHFDQALKTVAKTGSVELFNLTERLKVLLETCFLLELGLSSSIVKTMIKRSRAYQYVARMVDHSL